ncbi:MAG: DUF3667 domain-containing protein [Psychroserpens sp.]|uniref:DUF3667 domain-containing protein n=1 Tax=Psychroserpens sp. TaxID=2020870 RepID=UPI003C74FBC5
MSEKLSQVTEDFPQCQNCERKLQEQFEFCPNCGQKTNEELTIGVLFYNTISNYFSFDARFFKSFIPLMFKPGFLAEKFLGGKRLMYLHPAQMYLFVSVVFFFIFSFTVNDQTKSINEELRESRNKEKPVVHIDSIAQRKNDVIKEVNQKRKDSIARVEIRKALNDNKWLTGMDDKVIDSLMQRSDFRKNKAMNFDFSENKIDSLISQNVPDEEIYQTMGLNEDAGWLKKKLYKQALKFYKARDGGSILKTFYDTIPIALFVLLPIFAFILKILYFNKGRYAHHLVFSFYYFSFLFTVFSLIFGINRIYPIPWWIDLLITLSTFIYLLIALHRFYRQGWFLSLFKCGVATFTFMMLVLPFAVVIMALFAFLFY